MKKLFLTAILAIGATLALPALAATDQMMNTAPSAMQSNMQQMMQMKTKKMARKMMYLGLKMYSMGKSMMAQNMDSATAKSMISNGTKLYNMGMQMNGGNPMDMSKCYKK